VVSGIVIAVMLVSYVLLVIVVGVLASLRSKGLAGYFIAERKLGAWVGGLSSVASSESGWITLGAVGMGYSDGASAIWFVPGCLLGYVINWYLIAPRLRRVTADQGSITIPDYLAVRFDDKKHVVRTVAVVIVFLCMMGYVAAQFTASGKVFRSVFQMDYATGVLLGAAVTILYTLLGGFRAVSWTDVIQAGLMAFGLGVMPVIAIWHMGGIGGMLASLQTVDGGNFLSVTGGKSAAAAMGTVIGLLGIGLGYPGQPHVLARYMATRDETNIRRGRLIAITWGIVAFYGAVILGHAARVLLPELADAEYAFPRVAVMLLPSALAGLMIAAVVAAVMSTADSQLLVAASSVARDLFDRMLFRGRVEERRLVLISRITVLVLGILSILFALSEVRVVFWFVLFAWSGLGASFGPLLILSLYWKGTTRAGAVAGMITGFVVTVVWKKVPVLSGALYELVPAFFLSALAIVAVSLLTRKDSKSRAENPPAS